MSNKYTREEVEQNDGKNGKPTWIIYKNSVYDVTKYLEEHPGGAYLIEEWAGKDATKAFNKAGHSGDAENELQKLKIGELEKEIKIENFADNITSEQMKKEKRRLKLLFCI